MDYMKEMPCMHEHGGTIAGAYATLTYPNLRLKHKTGR